MAVTGTAWGNRKQNAMCCILLSWAKLLLLWQPESGPIPVAMVEEDRVVTLFIRQQNASAILSSGCGNIYYKWKAEEFLIDICFCDQY